MADLRTNPLSFLQLPRPWDLPASCPPVLRSLADAARCFGPLMLVGPGHGTCGCLILFSPYNDLLDIIPVTSLWADDTRISLILWGQKSGLAS